MCTGIEIAMLAGVALSAVSAVQQGQADKEAADFQADINDQQAQREREVSARESAQFDREQRALLARSRAIRAGSGIEIDSGTPLLTDRASVEEIELGKATILSGGEAKSTRLQQEAELIRRSGKNAQTSGYLKGGSSLLTGAAKVWG